MRPVKKWAVGQVLPTGEVIRARYTPYNLASPPLHDNLDTFCSYCEVVSSDLEVEHMVSKDQDRGKETDWNNFLLACGRCNGKENKSNNPVDLQRMYFPHECNTLLAFEYQNGGYVGVHRGLATAAQRERAEEMIKLIGLDKYPGSPLYAATPGRPFGFNPNDKRWEWRRTAWEDAQLKIDRYQKGELTADDVAEFAYQRGCFSIWFTVFSAHIDVKKALVERFKGTDLSCFDRHFNPIPRNPTNATDPI